MQYQYDLVAGDPALNFINTIHDWTSEQPRDYLGDFADALRFGEAAGILSRTERNRLATVAAGSELSRLRTLRASLQRIFRAVVDGRTPAASDIDGLVRDAAASTRARRLRRTEGRYSMWIAPELAGAATLRWRIVEAALELLTSTPAQVQRIKACPACGWFFRDESKSATRRWCSMSMCGSAVKSRRYYWQNKRGQ